MGLFTHISAYSGISRHQPDIIRPVIPDIFKTLVYSEPWQIQNQRHVQNLGVFRTMECFVKIFNVLYEINIMNFSNACVILTPIVFILCKNNMES